MSSRGLWLSALRSGGLILSLGGLAWLTGEPLIFPSLGPTAFVLSYRSSESLSAKTVIGGHFWGTVSGLVAYHLLAPGAVLTGLDAPVSMMGGQLAASGALATAMTSALMIGTRSVHPPACATTLIVSLGLLSTVLDGALIVAAVSVLYILGSGTRRLFHVDSERDGVENQY